MDEQKINEFFKSGKILCFKKRKRKQCIIRQNNKKYLTHKRNLSFKKMKKNNILFD